MSWEGVTATSVISIVIVAILMITGCIYTIRFIKTIYVTSKTEEISKVPTAFTIACIIAYELAITFCFFSFVIQANNGESTNPFTFLFFFMYLIGNLLMILVFIHRIDYPFRGSIMYSYTKKTLKIVYTLFIILIILVLWLAVAVAALNKIKIIVFISVAILGILLVSLSITLFIMFTKKLKQMHRSFVKITYSSTDNQVDTHHDDDNLADLYKLIRKFTVLYTFNILSTFLFFVLAQISDQVFQDKGGIEYFITRIMFIFDAFIGIFTMYFTLKQHADEYYTCCGSIDRCCDTTCTKCNSDVHERNYLVKHGGVPSTSNNEPSAKNKSTSPITNALEVATN